MAFISGGRLENATGGTISTINGYKVHIFDTVGLNTFTPTTNGLIEVLVVGGAAAGSAQTGGSGGGGGGSVLYQKIVRVSAGVAYTMSIGAGGIDGNVGGNTVIKLPTGTITAYSGDVGIGSFGKTIFSSVPSTIDEGSSGTFNVTTDKILDGITLYWTINDITTNSTDFGATSGSFIVNSNAGSFTVPIAINLFVEGAETFTVSVRDSGTSGNVLTTSSVVTIPAKTYAFSSIPSTINEGASGTFNVTTTNVANATTLFWNTDHITTNSADFTSNSGSFTITSNAGTFTVPIASDQLIDGSETFRIQLKYASEELVATSNPVTIVDTTLVSTASTTVIDEGQSVTFTTQAQGFANGTTLYYDIVGSAGITAADFTSNLLSGTYTVSSGVASTTLTATGDGVTEIDETFQLGVKTSAGGSILTYSPAVTINSIADIASINATGAKAFSYIQIPSGPRTFLNYITSFGVTGTSSNDGGITWANGFSGAISFAASPITTNNYFTQSGTVRFIQGDASVDPPDWVVINFNPANGNADYDGTASTPGSAWFGSESITSGGSNGSTVTKGAVWGYGAATRWILLYVLDLPGNGAFNHTNGNWFTSGGTVTGSYATTNGKRAEYDTTPFTYIGFSVS